MKIGISSPVLLQHPLTASEWEREAGIDDLARIAETADQLGYHHLTCAEHVVVPTAIARERGGTYWDPAATFGFLAARTHQIRLATQVLVLGYHHPLEIAKRYGTVDILSKGRLVLGLGVGSLREEFTLLGAPFEDRGLRADDALRALRASLGRAEPEYAGTYYDFRDVVVEPHALRTDVPLWIGGRSARSLRRAIELGDGWVPFGLSPSELATMLKNKDLPDRFEVVLSAGPLDPLANPDHCRRGLDELRQTGATIVGASLAADDAAHYQAQLTELVLLAEELGCQFHPPIQESR